MRYLRPRQPLAESSGARVAGVFSPDRLADLPEPARRYLRHAIAPETPLARIARLEVEGSMLPRPGGPRVALTRTRFSLRTSALSGRPAPAYSARLRGGRWYGTDRFDPDAAAEFVIRAASF